MHDFCMKESARHEMVIRVSKRFSCKKCLGFFSLFINFNHYFLVDAESVIVKIKYFNVILQREIGEKYNCLVARYY